MAQRTLVRLVDDLDGTDIAEGEGETVTFALDGVQYEIDLTQDNAGAMREAFASYVGHGRRIGSSQRAGGTRSNRQASSGKRASEETKAIKEWAAANGMQVAQRGRVAQSVVDAYNAAH